jgi:hypothetical protein
MKKKIIEIFLITLAFYTVKAEKLTGFFSYSLNDKAYYLSLNSAYYRLEYNEGFTDDIGGRSCALSVGTYTVIGNKIFLYDVIRKHEFKIDILNSRRISGFDSTGNMPYGPYYSYLALHLSLNDFLGYQNIIFSGQGDDDRTIIYYKPDSVYLSIIKCNSKRINIKPSFWKKPYSIKFGLYNCDKFSEENNNLRLYKNGKFTLESLGQEIASGKWWQQQDSIVLYDKEFKVNYFLKITKPNELKPLNLPTYNTCKVIHYRGLDSIMLKPWYQRIFETISQFFVNVWEHITNLF